MESGVLLGLHLGIYLTFDSDLVRIACGMIAWFGPGWITFYEGEKKQHYRQRKSGIETSTALRESCWETTRFGLEMFIELPGDSNRFLSALSGQKSGTGLREAAVHDIERGKKKQYTHHSFIQSLNFPLIQPHRLLPIHTPFPRALNRSLLIRKHHKLLLNFRFRIQNLIRFVHC